MWTVQLDHRGDPVGMLKEYNQRLVPIIARHLKACTAGFIDQKYDIRFWVSQGALARQAAGEWVLGEVVDPD